MNADAKSRMDRIIRLHEEIDSIKADIRDVYAEEKADGGDKTAMGAAISIIRKREKDRTAFDDREAMVDVYLNAYASPSHTHAREGRSYAEEKGREQPLHQTATGTEQGHVESSAPRASSAVRVGATNSPDGQQGSEPCIGHATDATSLAAHEADKAAAPNIPDPRFTAVPGGEPSNPSSEADGAKMEGYSPPDRAAKAEVESINSEQAAPSIPHSSDAPPPVETKAETVAPSSPAVSATISDADVPAFLKKDKPGCGKLKGGQCKLSFQTSALCSDCQRAVDAARAA